MIEQVTKRLGTARRAVAIPAKTWCVEPVPFVTRETVSPPPDETAPCLPTRLPLQPLFEKQPRLTRLPLWNSATQRLNELSALIKRERYGTRRITRLFVTHLTYKRRTLTPQVLRPSAVKLAFFVSLKTPITPNGPSGIELPLPLATPVRDKLRIMPAPLRIELGNNRHSYPVFSSKRDSPPPRSGSHAVHSAANAAAFVAAIPSNSRSVASSAAKMRARDSCVDWLLCAPASRAWKPTVSARSKP